MVVDIEELEKIDASEIHAKRLNAKEVITPASGELCWRRSGTENIHPDTGSPTSRRKSSRFSVKHEIISGPFPKTSFTDISLGRESNSTRREKNHSPFH